MAHTDEVIWESDDLYIEVESSEIPWLKIFTKTAYSEMSQVPSSIKMEIYNLLDIIEKEMLSYYKPTKINIASFGNYLPHVHWHIMARFREDSYFPEPMWGIKQREADLSLASMSTFAKKLQTSLPNTKRLKQP